MRSAVCRVCAFTLAVLTAFASFPGWAQTPPDAGHARPLVIPQAEGEREGKTLGRALACGAERERVERVLRAGRARMLAAVGRALTEERYVLSLDDAMRLETSLPAPSPASCEKALAALERLEKTP